VTILDPTDPRGDIDRMAADGRISGDDAATLHDFVSFLGDPTSRCPICLQGDHASALDCPEVSDEEKAAARARRAAASTASTDEPHQRGAETVDELGPNARARYGV
jgi:hypothetical protein